jgi:hypothetical protein
MKKYALGILAVVLAISLSSFTAHKTTGQTVYYQIDGMGAWHSTTADPCLSGTVPDCVVQTPDGNQKIFDAPNGNPFLRP